MVILDEATAYIDPENEAVIQRAVSELTRIKPGSDCASTFTITDMTQIFVVNEGQIVAEAPPGIACR